MHRHGHRPWLVAARCWAILLLHLIQNSLPRRQLMLPPPPFSVIYPLTNEDDLLNTSSHKRLSSHQSSGPFSACHKCLLARNPLALGPSSLFIRHSLPLILSLAKLSILGSSAS